MKKHSLPPDIRLSDDHMATAMFAERIDWEEEHGDKTLLDKNPDARALYFHGVQDTLVSLETWANEGLAPEVLEDWIAKLRKQTDLHNRSNH